MQVLHMMLINFVEHQNVVKEQQYRAPQMFSEYVIHQ